MPLKEPTPALTLVQLPSTRSNRMVVVVKTLADAGPS
jgi:hypothetical protein